MLIKAEVGFEVSAIDVGGRDTHFAQGGSTAQMANLMQDLAVTTDYRDVLSETLVKRLNNPATDATFPDCHP